MTRASNASARTTTSWTRASPPPLPSRLPDQSKLLFSGSLYYGDKNVPGTVTSVTVGEQRDTRTMETVLLDLNRVGSDRLDTEIVFSHNFGSLDWEAPAEKAVHDLHTVNFVNRWGWFASEELFLRIGGDAQYSSLDSTSVGKVHTTEGGLYVTAEISLGRLQLIPSLKTVFRENDAPVPVPKFGLAYKVSDEVGLKNNYFRTFKFPTLNDLYWPADSFAKGNPDLKPEDGFGADFNLSYRKAGAFTFEGSLHTSYYRDAISWQSSAGLWRPDNIGKAWYLGSDDTVKSDLSDVLKLTLNYSFLMTYVLSDGYGLNDDKRMPYQPVHTFGLGLEIDWKHGSLSLTERYVGERYSTVLNVTRLDPYFTLDVDLVQRMGIYSLLLSIKNAFGADYRLVDGYPMPGCTIYTGLKLNYEKK